MSLNNLFSIHFIITRNFLKVKLKIGGYIILKIFFVILLV